MEVTLEPGQATALVLVLRPSRIPLFLQRTLGLSSKEADTPAGRLETYARVLEEILNLPEAIPQELLDKTECVVIFASVKKLAFIFGSTYGRGTMVCRTGKDFTGPWGPPAMYSLRGVRGVSITPFFHRSTDYVLLVMNPRGVDSLLDSKVKLGADVAAVAGPKDRATIAATNAYMRAEILSYSHSRGRFAGVSLKGHTLRPDDKTNKKFYGRKISAREIVLEGKVALPAAGSRLVSLLQEASPRNLSEHITAQRE